MKFVKVGSIIGFVVGALPLLASAFFSPGVDSEGLLGYVALTFGLVTLFGLIASALHQKWMWGLVVLQVVLIGLVFYETFSDAALYVGT
jgi:apolipoprotein N-acyltransferase